MNIPIIINNRDLLTWPKAMVEKCKTYIGVGDIIIYDNNSTYPALLDWYKTSPCKIIRSDVNRGHKAPWDSGLVKSLKNIGVQYYIVTDPDLGIDDTPIDTLLKMVDVLQDSSIDKIALGLDWRIVGMESPYYNHVNTYERDRYERSRIIDGVLLDVVSDTTFCMYKTYDYFIGGSSLSDPHVATHYPWNLTESERKNHEEFMYYINNASNSSSYKTFLGL